MLADKCILFTVAKKKKEKCSQKSFVIVEAASTYGIVIKMPSRISFIGLLNPQDFNVFRLYLMKRLKEHL